MRKKKLTYVADFLETENKLTGSSLAIFQLAPWIQFLLQDKLNLHRDLQEKIPHM